jgi:hypothetical protein
MDPSRCNVHPQRQRLALVVALYGAILRDLAVVVAVMAKGRLEFVPAKSSPSQNLYKVSRFRICLRLACPRKRLSD